MGEAAQRGKIWLAMLLLCAGILPAVFADHIHKTPTFQLAAVTIVLALCAVPPMARLLGKAMDQINLLSQRHPYLLALAISLLVIPFLWTSARVQGVPNFPRWNDEFSYLIQMHLLAHGTLWEPAHPLGKFFDALYLINTPVYASMYFPGTALMMQPAVWFNLSDWAMPIIVYSISAGLLFLVVTALVDGASGVLALAILSALTPYRVLSNLILSQGPMLLLGLAMMLAWVRWSDSQHKKRWLILLGAASGWAAITRPADALSFALAIGLAMAWAMRRSSLKEWLITTAIVVACAAPFLSLQIIFNLRVTGHWSTTPYTYWLSREFPGTAFGFHTAPPGAHPLSHTPQIVLAYHEPGNLPAVQAHRLDNVWDQFISARLPLVWNQGFPSPLFWIIVPLGLLTVLRSRAAVLTGTLAIAFIIYAAYVSFVAHYIVPYLPAIIIVLVIGIRATSLAFGRLSRFLRPFLFFTALAICILCWPQVDPTIEDDGMDWSEMQQINDYLSTRIQKPAVVLFHFNNSVMFHGQLYGNLPDVEPAYNGDVAWPDDAPIIRGNDQNADFFTAGTPADQNKELYWYYARVSPKRHIYIYDRLPEPIIHDLGTAESLAKLFPPPATSNSH